MPGNLRRPVPADEDPNARVLYFPCPDPATLQICDLYAAKVDVDRYTACEHLIAYGALAWVRQYKAEKQRAQETAEREQQARRAEREARRAKPGTGGGPVSGDRDGTGNSAP